MSRDLTADVAFLKLTALIEMVFLRYGSESEGYPPTPPLTEHFALSEN